jgi:transcriptional regulator with XRE-family HTH domain
MLKALAQALRGARERLGFSLQGAAGPAGISAPYLQKLERGVVDTPSPRVLARLAVTLEVPYLRLMELAGYLDEEQRAGAQSRAPEPHPLAGQELSADEWRTVGAFIRGLKARREPGGGQAPGPRHQRRQDGSRRERSKGS